MNLVVLPLVARLGKPGSQPILATLVRVAKTCRPVVISNVFLPNAVQLIRELTSLSPVNRPRARMSSDGLYCLRLYRARRGLEEHGGHGHDQEPRNGPVPSQRAQPAVRHPAGYALMHSPSPSPRMRVWDCSAMPPARTQSAALTCRLGVGGDPAASGGEHHSAAAAEPAGARAALRALRPQTAAGGCGFRYVLCGPLSSRRHVCSRSSFTWWWRSGCRSRRTPRRAAAPPCRSSRTCPSCSPFCPSHPTSSSAHRLLWCSAWLTASFCASV